MGDSSKYRAILIFGAPGSGKGTQGKAVGTLPGFVHLSMGDVFRSLDADSPLGRVFKQYSSQGQLVPDAVTVQLWVEHVGKLVSAGRHRPQTDVMILDGLPRNPQQADLIEGHVHPLRLIHLEAADEAQMVERLKRRALLEGRQDDADETVIRSRFRAYDAETRPVLQCYPRELVWSVNAVQTPLEVMRDVIAGILAVL
jgi:adenylate kinase